MRYSVTLIMISSIFLVTCRKKGGFEAVEVHGHAGMGLRIENSVYHANSREAVELAVSIAGCNGVEIDVQLSKDGKLWLYHDKTLDEESTGTGCVNDLSSSELEKINFKSLRKEKLARLDQLDPEIFVGKTLFLDIRHFNACSETFVSSEQILQEILMSPVAADERIKLYCVLSNAQWIDQFVAAGMDVIYSAFTVPSTIQLLNNYPDLQGVMIKNAAIDKDQLAEIRGMGKKVFIFEMRSPKGIRRALQKEPNGLITDDIRTTLIEKY